MKDSSDVRGFGNFDNGMCKRILDPLELSYLRFLEVVIKRVAVIKFFG